MTIDYYRHFITIVEEGSILAAAHKLYLAQPALSAQLKRMETACGTELLFRGPRNVTLTEPGKIFYKKAKAIVALADEAQEEIDNCLAGSMGTLSLALPPTNSDVFIQELLARFMADHPSIRYSIHESASRDTAEMILAGQAEIGFVRAPIANQSLFHVHPLEREAMGAMLPKTLVQGIQAISFQELMRHELCVSRGVLPVVKEECQRQSLSPTIFAVTGSLSVAISVARLRHCIALIPAQYRKEEPADMTFVKISDCQLSLFRAFITKKEDHLSKIGDLFLNYAQDIYPLGN